MATQIFTIDWNETPAGKPILNKQEIIEYCKQFNQHGLELDNFLTRFDFDEWKCIELGIEYSYGKHSDKSGSVGNDPATFLSVISDTFLTEKGELALKNYIGIGKNKFQHPEEPQFVTFEDCPLWVVQVSEDTQFYTRGIVFMPAVFWEDATMTEESYAASPYGIESNYNSWYNDAYGKNRMRAAYRKYRIGSSSPNFLERVKTDIDLLWKPVYFDQFENRILVIDKDAGKLNVYGLDPLEIVYSKEIAQLESIHILESEYHLHYKKHMEVTDKELHVLSTVKEVIVNEYHNDFWDVLVKGKGLFIKRATDADYIKYKSSDFKLTTSEYSNRSEKLNITSNGNNSLIFSGQSLTVVDPEIKIKNHSFSKLFQKEINPFLGPQWFFGTQTSISIDKNRQWFFTEETVFEMNETETPQLLNTKLYQITGEYSFYGGVYDTGLKGIWLTAGLNRLVFVTENLEKGYVFNFTEQDDLQGMSYPMQYLFLDKDSNLWFSFLEDRLYKIEHRELKGKLETAVAFAGN